MTLTLALTYALHALVWAAAAGLFGRVRSLSASSRNLGFKIAVFGPFLSTLVSTALPADARRTVMRAEPAVLAAATGRVPLVVVPRATAPCVAAAAGLGLVRFVALLTLLRRRLATRSKVRDGRVLARCESLRARSRLRRVSLSESARVTSPLVLGTSEICLPRGTLRTLPDAELDAVLAHELAHLERGDGLWFKLVGLVEAVLWFHPVNHWLSARFRQSAELASDDRAVALTADPRALARALVRIASATGQREPALTPAMARSTSRLALRVQRLTAERSSLGRDLTVRGRSWLVASCAALGVAVAGVSVRVAKAEPQPLAPPMVATVAPRADSEERAADPAVASLRVAESLAREQSLELELAAASGVPGAERPGTPASVRVLELGQALRHTRESEIWLEERFVRASERAAHYDGASTR